MHRDLKPENLFFARGEDGNGTRSRCSTSGSRGYCKAQAITSYGLALGTPSFMSPEQAAGRIDEIDGRTDLFALAATGFRLRAGRRIHEADDAVELVKKMAQSPAPRLKSVVPDVSEPYARVIDRALEFKREDRYENALAMQAEVRRALAELPRAADAAQAPAAPAPRPASPPARKEPEVPASEPTIELSERDLEQAPPPGLDESIHIPKRRSVLPWLALLVCSAFGFKLWFDAHSAPSDAATGEASSASSPGSTGSAANRAIDAGPPRPHPVGPRRQPPRPLPGAVR